MKIQKMLSQNRRDFYANMVCEGCGETQKNVPGYDDSNFHQNLMPSKICPKCGESSISLKSEIRPQQTKYSDNGTI